MTQLFGSTDESTWRQILELRIEVARLQRLAAVDPALLTSPDPHIARTVVDTVDGRPTFHRRAEPARTLDASWVTTGGFGANFLERQRKAGDNDDDGNPLTNGEIGARICNLSPDPAPPPNLPFPAFHRPATRAAIDDDGATAWGDWWSFVPLDWIAVKNTHADPVPAGGVLRLIGPASGEDPFVEVGQPNGTFYPWYATNSLLEIPGRGSANPYGLARVRGPCLLSVSAGAPSLTYGAVKDSFGAYGERSGWGHIVGFTNALVVTPYMVTSGIGKAGGAIAKNASGTVTVWAGAPGSEATTDQTLTAYNRTAAITSGAWVSWMMINGHYYCAPLACD